MGAVWGRGSKMFNSLFSDIRDEAMTPVEARTTLLGYGGLIPFFTLLILLWLPSSLIGSTTLVRALNWGMMYSAISLSFMGGIHWGIALMMEREERPLGPVLERFSGSVMPALIGWIALVPDQLLAGSSISGVWRFGLMLFAFLYLLVADRQSVRYGLLPEWYGRLREKLTFFLSMTLLLIIIRLYQLYGL